MSLDMNTIAWCGSILLSFCGIPELLKTIRYKRCDLSWGFLLMWGFGEVFILLPVISRKLGAFLVFNYTLNILIISLLIYYKVKGNEADWE